MKRHRWLIAVAAAGWIIAGVVMARQGIVVTRDGTKYQGDITEKSDSINVTIHDVETSLPRSQVDSITYTDSFDTEFANRMAKLGPKDVDGRLQVARWALDQQQYSKAREAVDSAQQIDPNSREAADLQNLITSQIRLESSKAGPDTTPPPPTPVGAVDRRYLSPDDVNLIRQLELQPSDKLTVRFENGVDHRFVQYANLQYTQFNALKPVDKALKIINDGDPTMGADVRILGDPMSLRIYRQSIEPVILNGCAASACHGSTKGGNFILFSPATSDQITYTNFYILTQYQKKVTVPNAGVFDSPIRYMIDRGHGARSLLAQYGLPASISDQDHPTVAGYNGIFRNTLDPKYKQLVDWMDNSLKNVAPDYRIHYQLPGAATQPTTRP